MVKIFFASDVHGSEVCFKKFLNAGKVYEADAIILGGDLTGKMIVPIVRQGRRYVSEFSGRTWNISSDEELDGLSKMIRDSGYYPYVTYEREMEELNADITRVNELFSNLMVETMRRWIKIANERLKGTNISCYITPGNDDRFAIDKVLEEGECVKNPEGKVALVKGEYEMISTGFSNPTPWKTPREITEDELEKKIEEMTSKIKDMRKCIFNVHCPPYNTTIDTAPQLDENLKIVTRAGQMLMIPAGSVAVRNSIKKHQPLLGLHGHIHESRGAVKIGKTLCLNPGSEYNEGILRGVIVNLKDANVKSYLFTSG